VATVGTIQMFSRALGFPVTYTILLPEPDVVGPGPYHALVQLHGKFDAHTAWLYKSRLLDYVHRLPLLVVLPDGGNYFWTDLTPFTRYETFVVQDLIGHVTTMFPVRRDSRWAIGGLSMGGFGALRLGLKYPDQFCSIYAHSSVIPAQDELVQWPEAQNAKGRADMDCYRLSALIDRAALPRLGFDCGVDDDLIEHNRRFHAHLEKLKLPHHYAEHPGKHDWAYWDEHVETALCQHAEILNIKPVAPSA
jgi:putative tributyrin esterase